MKRYARTYDVRQQHQKQRRQHIRRQEERDELQTTGGTRRSWMMVPWASNGPISGAIPLKTNDYPSTKEHVYDNQLVLNVSHNSVVMMGTLFHPIECSPQNRISIWQTLLLNETLLRALHAVWTRMNIYFLHRRRFGQSRRWRLLCNVNLRHMHNRWCLRLPRSTGGDYYTTVEAILASRTGTVLRMDGKSPCGIHFLRIMRTRPTLSLTKTGFSKIIIHRYILRNMYCTARVMMRSSRRVQWRYSQACMRRSTALHQLHYVVGLPLTMSSFWYKRWVCETATLWWLAYGDGGEISLLGNDSSFWWWWWLTCYLRAQSVQFPVDAVCLFRGSALLLRVCAGCFCVCFRVRWL